MTRRCSRAHRGAARTSRSALLTLIWGINWIAMKFALQRAHPVDLQRAAHMARGRRCCSPCCSAQRRPRSGRHRGAPSLVTGFFQTTINFGATTMALAGGGAGRTSVLVFTMPFWTLLIAWPVLHERVRGSQWSRSRFALAGLVLVVEPWNWQGDLAPKLWAVLSGFGWAAGTVAIEVFPARPRASTCSTSSRGRWLVGVLPLTLAAVAASALPRDAMERDVRGCCCSTSAWCRRRSASCCGSTILRCLPAGTASLNMFAIPVIALAVVDGRVRRAADAATSGRASR